MTKKELAGIKARMESVEFMKELNSYLGPDQQVESKELTQEQKEEILKELNKERKGK